MRRDVLVNSPGARLRERGAPAAPGRYRAVAAGEILPWDGRTLDAQQTFRTVGSMQPHCGANPPVIPSHHFRDLPNLLLARSDFFTFRKKQQGGSWWCGKQSKSVRHSDRL